MLNSYSVFEGELEYACSEYKHLRIRERGGIKYLSGIIDVCDTEGTVIQSFFIEIHHSEKYPYRFPLMYEVGGYIPNSPDWHKYSDDLCCLTAEPIEIITCKTGITLCSFIQNHAIPYLANQYYRKEFGQYKNEYSHGLIGLYQAYSDIMKTMDVSLWRQYLMYAFGPTKVTVSRNEVCFCGSGKKYKHCHLQVFQNLRNLGKDTVCKHLQILKVI